jgi:8-oxo-dGTP pyrophosphatase MutT (NUDIX family)
MAMKTETMRRQPDFPKVVLEPNVDFLGKVFGAFFERYGSVESYYEAIGLAEDATNLLANLLGRQEKSCGAVVFHEGKVLVEHMGKGHYSLPKGHVELADQGDKETALREIKEETGLEAKIISDKSYAVDYSPEEGVAKRVLFFAAEANTTETTPQPEEILAIYWLSPEDAIRTVSHISDKKVIRWACGIASEGR